MATVAFTAIAKELEWQKTNLALGNPVDVELLLLVCERMNDRIIECEKEVEDAKKEQKDAEEGKSDAENSRDELAEVMEAFTALSRAIGEELVEKKVAVKLGKQLVEAAGKADKKAEELCK